MPEYSFEYIECSIPAGVTIAEYRRSRRTGSRRRWLRLRALHV